MLLHFSGVFVEDGAHCLESDCHVLHLRETEAEEEVGGVDVRGESRILWARKSPACESIIVFGFDIIKALDKSIEIAN